MTDRLHPFALALTPSEGELLMRAVRELAEREDDPRAWDVVAMVENAVHVVAVAALAPREKAA